MAASRLLKVCVAALLLASQPAAAPAAGIAVFAAASLSDVLKQAGAAYETKSGRTATLSFAASSVLARQIEASSGADVFISADRDWMDYLEKKGLIAPGTRTDLLANHLVLIAPRGAHTQLKIAPHFDLKSALGDGRLAIADPHSVPAGRYGMAALSTLGVWASVAGQTVQAENVRVALAYVARGEAPLGIVYRTDALAEPDVVIVDEFPDGTHPPIVYPAALTRDAAPEARGFLDFLRGPQASAIFTKAGFAVLGTTR